MAPIDRMKEFSHKHIVEVKSSWEILQTLDRDGKLEGLPFMPEMLAYCGKHIRVLGRADRTCVVGHGVHRMRSAVFLQDSRCDGSHHDGCQRACLLFWKDAWLRPLGSTGSIEASPTSKNAAVVGTLAQLTTRHGDRYVCQSTELAAATTPISRWDIRPWLREVFRGELTAGSFLALVAGTLATRVFRLAPKNLLAGKSKTHSRGDLDLTTGEWVRVKSTGEICATLDEKGSNRGLVFQRTMNPAIGQRYQVAFPVRRIIVENTGVMVKLNNTVALKDVTCQGACVAHCARSEYLYWRESWLQREAGDVAAHSLATAASHAIKQ